MHVITCQKFTSSSLTESLSVWLDENVDVTDSHTHTVHPTTRSHLRCVTSHLCCMFTLDYTSVPYNPVDGIIRSFYS